MEISNVGLNRDGGFETQASGANQLQQLARVSEQADEVAGEVFEGGHFWRGERGKVAICTKNRKKM